MLAEASHDAQVGAPMEVVISAREMHDPKKTAMHLGFHPQVALPLYNMFGDKIAQCANDFMRSNRKKGSQHY